MAPARQQDQGNGPGRCGVLRYDLHACRPQGAIKKYGASRTRPPSLCSFRKILNISYVVVRFLAYSFSMW